MSQIISEKRPGQRSSDVWIGLVLLAVGGAAAWMASGFDDASRPYPLALSVLMMLLGAVLSARALLGGGEDQSFTQQARILLPAAAVLGFWILALSNGLGYVVPTFAMEFAFMWLCGIRGPGRAALYAGLVTGVSYAIFVGLLDVRLPASHLPWLF